MSSANQPLDFMQSCCRTAFPDLNKNIYVFYSDLSESQLTVRVRSSVCASKQVLTLIFRKECIICGGVENRLALNCITAYFTFTTQFIKSYISRSYLLTDESEEKTDKINWTEKEQISKAQRLKLIQS